MDNNNISDPSTQTIPNSATPPNQDIALLNQRRALIKSLYMEVLGREADINGLSYYTVHKEITEDEIRKQMSQSVDHRDLVIRAQKYPDLEKKCIELEDQVLKLQNINNEKDNLIQNLRALAATTPIENRQISQGQNQSYAYDMMQNQVQQPQQYDQHANYGQNMDYFPQTPPQNQGINITKLKYPKGRGPLGFIKSLFGK